MTSVSSNVVPLRGSLPKSMSFYQFESFMWSSMTSLQCDVDIPLVLLEISFSGAHSIAIVSPSICRPPSMKLGEYLARQVLSRTYYFNEVGGRRRGLGVEGDCSK